jgi:hypothetical protein
MKFKSNHSSNDCVWITVGLVLVECVKVVSQARNEGKIHSFFSFILIFVSYCRMCIILYDVVGWLLWDC